RLDLADVRGDQRLHRLLARENARARLTHARRTERVGGARPAELRRRALAALQERRRRPRRLKRRAVDAAVEGLKCGPEDAGGPREGEFERRRRVHPESQYTTTFTAEHARARPRRAPRDRACRPP